MRSIQSSPVILVVILAIGCAEQPKEPVSNIRSVSLDFDASKYLLADEPDGAVGVITAREEVEDGQEVVVVGRIGGSAKPWIEGRAAFVLADAAALAEADAETCSEDGCEEECTKACCARDKELFGGTALVKFMDEQGRTLAADARELFGVKVKDMVVVRGRAKRDESGNLTILANGLYLRR